MEQDSEAGFQQVKILLNKESDYKGFWSRIVVAPAADAVYEGGHLELQLLPLRNTYASWYRLDVQVDSQGAIRTTFCPVLSKSFDMMLFLAMCLSFGHHNHKGHGNYRYQDARDDVRRKCFSEDKSSDQNGRNRFEDSQD